ncbi:hypothetical protein ABPG72_007835 [Tetrahymena utriculariae]
MASRIQSLNNQIKNKQKLLTAVTSSNLPQPIAPFSHAVAIKANSKLLFVSGQISRDAKSGKFVHSDNVALQTEQTLINLREVLKAGGSDLQYVVKCTVYLNDMAHFNKVNEVYAKFFNTDVKPARACFAVRELPAGAKVEIECIAVVP